MAKLILISNLGWADRGDIMEYHDGSNGIENSSSQIVSLVKGVYVEDKEGNTVKLSEGEYLLNVVGVCPICGSPAIMDIVYYDFGGCDYFVRCVSSENELHYEKCSFHGPLAKTPEESLNKWNKISYSKS